ncbi:MAG: hypothetical protein IPQ15_13610 [Betaproteobacteria bacterium]|nr:hypothetical protein [Betaproteobacteria bacterium]
MSVQGKVLTSDDAGMTVASATRGRRDAYFTGAGLGTPTCRRVARGAWNVEFQRNGITIAEPIMGVALGHDDVAVPRETSRSIRAKGRRRKGAARLPEGRATMRNLFTRPRRRRPGPAPPRRRCRQLRGHGGGHFQLVTTYRLAPA